MKRRTVLVTVALLAVAALFIWWYRGRGGGSTETKPVAETAQPKAPPVPKPHEQQQAANAPGSRGVYLAMDADPPGNLRLEGQVIDDNGDPVGGAVVFVDARPLKHATAGEDGSFSFDAMVGRRYAVRARAGDQVGGPVVTTLTANSDPVIVRVHAGSKMAVTVAARDSGSPISGATVALVGSGGASAQTAGDGVAHLRGLSPGWDLLVVSAPGYGTARVPVNVPGGADESTQKVELDRGVEVKGVVVSEAGKPIQGARVVPRSASAPWEPVDVLRDGVVTDGKGRFDIPGVPIGSFRFLAVHDDYAPGSSGVVSLAQGAVPAVRIVLSAGAEVSGQVVATSGAAAPWAQVHVSSERGQRGMWGGGVSRAVVAGDDGRFHIKGLPRQPMELFADTAQAATESVPVDLSATPKKDGVKLVLSVVGTISGTVVDDDGKPVAEVQVLAVPDFWGGGDVSALITRGPSFATTDGGGHFTVRGLQDGAYRVRATRTDLSNWWAGMGRGVKAHVGDANVKVVLQRDGAVVGRVQTTSGNPPAAATVQVAGGSLVPAVGDRFRVDGVHPGTFDLTVRGAGFPDKIVKNVDVKPGETTDVGVVTVERGRVISGRVVGSGGQGVDGATVVLGRQLVGDGANLQSSFGSSIEAQMGIRRTTTTPDGSFRFAGVGKDELAVAAEQLDVGRSLPVIVARGEADSNIALSLVPFGSVAGTVTIDGEPAPDVSVLITSSVGSRYVVAVRSGNDGRFVADRVAAGKYKVAAMVGSGVTSKMVAKDVEVTAGQQAQVDLSLELGKISLSITIKGQAGAKVDAAQVFLFGNPAIDVKVAGDINQLFLSESKAGDASMAFAAGAKPASFDKVKPGDKSVCVIPLTGDMNDPTFTQRVQRHAETLAVYCSRLTVSSTPEEQAQTIETPAMTPLPDD